LEARLRSKAAAFEEGAEVRASKNVFEARGGSSAQHSKTNRLDQGDALNSPEQPDTLGSRSSQARPDAMITNPLQARDKASSMPWGCGCRRVFIGC
jgi:hypothetical protein